MKIQDIFSQFASKRIAILGDVMMDAYVIGSVTRISPEAPVPIVSLSKKENRLGGAANVALNIVSLGAEAIICSVVGDDTEGDELIQIFDKENVNSSGIVRSKHRKTTVKTRIIGNNQQLLRVDSEQIDPISTDEENQLIQKVADLIQTGIDALIFEDYNKGVLTERVITAVLNLCKKANIPTTVDPKRDNFFAYKGVTLFKPNLKELKEGLNLAFDFKNEHHLFEQAVAILEEKLKNTVSFITLSEFGVFIKEGNQKHYIAAHLRNIADVSGAGDTVIAVATLCLIAGASIADIAGISNVAGGLVCEQSGVVSISKEELIKEWRRISSN